MKIKIARMLSLHHFRLYILFMSKQLFYV